MSPGATFERVYLALKEQLGSGRFGAGEPLEPGHLSEELNSSITPVRDALHRLVGEGLVEAPRSDGFRTPMVAEVGLRHLYAWNGKVLGLAVRTAAGAAMERDHPPQPDGTIASRTERLFLDIAARSGNPENVDSVARLNDRLRPIRRAEARLIIDPDLELAEIEEAARLAEAAPLRNSLAAYHRRRVRMAPQIVALLHRR